MDLSEKLENFKDHLRSRNEKEMKSSAIEILIECESILSFCNVYMEFVHPLWIAYDRTGELDESKVDEIKLKMDNVFKKNGNQLVEEFNAIMEENDKL